MGQSKFRYELTFLFISIENGGKQNSRNTLRVEINQFCDGQKNDINKLVLIEIKYYIYYARCSKSNMKPTSATT